MGRKKLPEDKKLKYEIKTRVSEAKYRELQGMLNPELHRQDISGLVRNILYNRKIRVYTYDCTMDKVMEELCGIRSELKAIGININQMTRVFNTYLEPKQREIFARLGFQKYMAIEAKVDRLLEIVSKLAVKWLSSDKP